MIGHFLLDDPTLKEAAHLSGLVLIDELDLHLHPTWQATFISALRKTFPRVQFVATTHSPLVLSSLRPDEIIVLELNDQDALTARTGDDVRDPRLRTVGELAAEFFEIDKLYPQPLGIKLNEYSVIAANRYRTSDELQRAQQLKAELLNQGIDPGELLEPAPNRITSMDELPDED
jgi:predicted ATP-binding protein involved in virulence